MVDKRLKVVKRDGIEAIWNLLQTGDVYYRAAGILLLEAYVKQLIIAGKWEYAARVVRAFRESDPYRFTRPKGKENVLLP